MEQEEVIMIRVLISTVIVGVGLSLAACESSRMVREDDSLNAPDESPRATGATGSQGDMGSPGEENGAGGGTASEDVK
jgi:hypothetical protein